MIVTERFQINDSKVSEVLKKTSPMNQFASVIFYRTYSLVKENSAIGIGEVSTLLYSQSSNQMDVETVKNLANTLKKYPTQYDKFKTNIQATINQLNELIQNECS